MRPPTIHVWQLPEVERESASFINSNLHSLVAGYDEVMSSIELFESALSRSMSTTEIETKRKLRSWARIGAKNGAIHLNGFAEVMTAITSLLKKCPTVDLHVDKDRMQDAFDAFQEAFPNIKSVRHSAAHPGEFSATPKEKEKHSSLDNYEVEGIIKIDNSKLFMSCSMIGDEFTSTYKGGYVSYPVNFTTIEKLQIVLKSFFESFVPVVTATRPVAAQ